MNTNTRDLQNELSPLVNGTNSRITRLGVIQVSDTEERVTVVVETTIDGTKDEVVNKINALIAK